MPTELNHTLQPGNSIVLVENDTSRKKFRSIELRYYDEIKSYSTYEGLYH